MHQTRIEQQLAGQTKQLLLVADFSTDHVRKLYSIVNGKYWLLKTIPLYKLTVVVLTGQSVKKLRRMNG